MHKCLRWTSPAYLDDELSHLSDYRRKRGSASSLDLIIHLTRLSKCGYRAFSVAGPIAWNSLPPHFTSASTVSILKPVLSFFFSLPLYLNSSLSVLRVSWRFAECHFCQFSEHIRRMSFCEGQCAEWGSWKQKGIGATVQRFDIRRNDN